MQHTERIAHYVAQLILVAGIHDGNALRIAIRRRFVVMINSAQHNHIATDARSGPLYYRTTNRRDVTFDDAFDDDVSAK